MKRRLPGDATGAFTKHAAGNARSQRFITSDASLGVFLTTEITLILYRRKLVCVCVCVRARLFSNTKTTNPICLKFRMQIIYNDLMNQHGEKFIVPAGLKNNRILLQQFIDPVILLLKTCLKVGMKVEKSRPEYPLSYFGKICAEILVFPYLRLRRTRRSFATVSDFPWLNRHEVGRNGEWRQFPFTPVGPKLSNSSSNNIISLVFF